jgi:hypothetical protein
MSDSPDGAAYINTSERVFRLGQVSEAAAALAGTPVPHQLNANTAVSKVLLEPAPEAKIKPISVHRDDSFQPNVPVASPHVRRNSTFAKVGGLLMILAPASVFASQLTGADIRPQLVIDSIRVVQAWSSTALGSLSFGPAKPRLVVEHSRAAKGEPAPLGLTLEGAGSGAVVHIAGLAQGMELSAGSAVGDGWEVPANYVGDVWIAPPEGFAGSVHLVAELRGLNGEVADRQTITLEWTSAVVSAPVGRQLTDSPTLASISSKPVQLRGDQNYRTDPVPPNGEEAKPIELSPDRTAMRPAELSEPTSQRQTNGELAVLVQRGKDLIATGDLAAARVSLRRAAEANDAEAALALGTTYDPIVFLQLKVYGLKPDAAMARSWYEKAAELGSSAAPGRLKTLADRVGTR